MRGDRYFRRVLTEYLTVTFYSFIAVSIPLTVYSPMRTLILAYITHALYFILFYIYFTERMGVDTSFTKFIFVNTDRGKRVSYLNNTLYSSLVDTQAYMYFILLITWFIIRGYTFEELTRFSLLVIALFLMNTFYSLLFTALLLYMNSHILSIATLVVVEALGIYLGNTYLSPIYGFVEKALMASATPLVVGGASIIIYFITVLRCRSEWM